MATFNVRPSLRPTLDPDGDGKADWRGFTDRQGWPDETCTDVAADCIPLVLENVDTSVQYQLRSDYRDYDIYFDGRPAGWIGYPIKVP